MLGRPMRTRLDLLRPNLKEQIYKKQDSMIHSSGNRQRKLNENDEVLIRNYNPGREKWHRGNIEKVIGDKHYTIREGSKVVKKHIDQLLPVKSQCNARKNNKKHNTPNIEESQRKDFSDQDISQEVIPIPITKKSKSAPEILCKEKYVPAQRSNTNFLKGGKVL